MQRYDATIMYTGWAALCMHGFCYPVYPCIQSRLEDLLQCLMHEVQLIL